MMAESLVMIKWQQMLDVGPPSALILPSMDSSRQSGNTPQRFWSMLATSQRCFNGLRCGGSIWGQWTMMIDDLVLLTWHVIVLEGAHHHLVRWLHCCSAVTHSEAGKWASHHSTTNRSSNHLSSGHVVYAKFWSYQAMLWRKYQTIRAGQALFILLPNCGEFMHIVASVSCSCLTGSDVVFSCFCSSATTFKMYWIPIDFSTNPPYKKQLFELLLPFRHCDSSLLLRYKYQLLDCGCREKVKWCYL